jgi:hypothetical protein
MIDESRNRSALEALDNVLILRKPLSEDDSEWVLEVLASEREFPRDGFMCR